LPRSTLFLLFSACALAQDPYATLPKNYSLEFENDYVVVSRARSFPGDKLPVHSHPAIPTVYVYLSDGGPIRFTHISPQFTIERPAVKAGAVRFNRNAQVETHEVEYLGDAPAEYLRIGLKTAPGARHRDARLKADNDFPWQDGQVRISRIRGNPGRLGRPTVIVNIDARTFVWRDPSKSARVEAFSSKEPPTLVLVELQTDPAH
jgi:hypothetical protein